MPEFFWDEDVIASIQNDPTTSISDDLFSKINAAAKPCSCCTCAKLEQYKNPNYTSSLVPCHDHHVHYHHEPKIQSKASSSELVNQNLKIKNSTTTTTTTSTNNNSCSKRIYNHHLNVIEKQNKAKTNNKISGLQKEDGKLQLNRVKKKN